LLPFPNNADELMASRRKEQLQASRRGGRDRVSAADKAVASGRAKRAAAANARRNLTTTKKATKMEVDKEIKTEAARSAKTKQAQEKKKAGGRVAAVGSRRQRSANKAANGAVRKAAPVGKNQNQQGTNKQMQQVSTKNAVVQVNQKPPSKKAVNAAMQAFKANGFNIPKGSQLVIRFETPANNANSQNNQGGKAKGKSPANNNQNNNKGAAPKKSDGPNRNNNNNNSGNRRRSGGRGNKS